MELGSDSRNLFFPVRSLAWYTIRLENKPGAGVESFADTLRHRYRTSRGDISSPANWRRLERGIRRRRKSHHLPEKATRRSRRPIGREALARLSNFLPCINRADRTPTRDAWKRRRYRRLRIISSQGRSRPAQCLSHLTHRHGSTFRRFDSDRSTRVPARRSSYEWKARDARAPDTRYPAYARQIVRKIKRWAQQGRFELLIHIECITYDTPSLHIQLYSINAYFISRLPKCLESTCYK